MSKVEFEVNPAIVVVTYNRPKSLQRLLTSISNASYSFENVQLIISIDYSDSKAHDEIITLAKKFQWSFGNKKIIEHKKNIGLRNHILSCGDMSQEYGSVIILEDDLIVSPAFYKYATEAKIHYQDELKVAGISLYSYEYEELGWFQFYPKNLGTDSFFMQWTSSWGQLWTYSQWKSFRDWYADDQKIEHINIPLKAKGWKKSWKKFHIAYLVDTDRYFVYPYHSYTTMRDEGGEHYQNDSRQNSVNLVSRNLKKKFLFSEINEDELKYDVFFQPVKKKFYIETLNKEITIEFDFFGTKEIDNFQSEYVCSIKQPNRVIESFSNKFIPYENNIEMYEYGNHLYLAKKEDFVSKMSVINIGKVLYNTRKIYAIKEMVIVIIYRMISKFIKI